MVSYVALALVWTHFKLSKHLKQSPFSLHQCFSVRLDRPDVLLCFRYYLEEVLKFMSRVFRCGTDSSLPVGLNSLFSLYSRSLTSKSLYVASINIQTKMRGDHDPMILCMYFSKSCIRYYKRQPWAFYFYFCICMQFPQHIRAKTVCVPQSVLHQAHKPQVSLQQKEVEDYNAH